MITKPLSCLQVIIDPATLTAVGVEYTRHGQTHVAMATKEVILSAGALQTPKILMLSGIGPADHLKSFGVNTDEIYAIESLEV